MVRNSEIATTAAATTIPNESTLINLPISLFAHFEVIWLLTYKLRQVVMYFFFISLTVEHSEMTQRHT